MSTKPVFAKAYKPRTKAKIEKLIGFVARDFIWEVKDSIPSLPALQRRWEEWCTWYNQRRPHASLGQRPPAHRYTPSRRTAPRELRKLLAVETVRRVRRDATISIAGKPFAVPAELMGKHVWVGLLGDQITIEHAATWWPPTPDRVFTSGVTDLFTLGGCVTIVCRQGRAREPANGPHLTESSSRWRAVRRAGAGRRAEATGVTEGWAHIP